MSEDTDTHQVNGAKTVAGRVSIFYLHIIVGQNWFYNNLQ